MATLYEILGIRPDATGEAIRNAFRDQAKRHHPDRAGGGGGAMVRLNAAYETLKDPARRAAYDETLARPLPKRPSLPREEGPDAFLARVFAPLDASVRGLVDALEAAIDELAYDLYDDRALLRFEREVREAASRLRRAQGGLMAGWPAFFDRPLTFYTQGLRQVEDALEEFDLFIQSLDSDLLVSGRSILRGGAELMAEGRGMLPG